MQKDFESVPHTADIKLRIFGATLKDLFTNALIGMFQSIKPMAPGCTYINERIICPQLPLMQEVNVSAPDKEALLVNFLSEAWYHADVDNCAYLAVDIQTLTETSLQATLRGIKITGFEVVEIKAVTYHDLYIKQIGPQWQAEIVFDI